MANRSYLYSIAFDRTMGERKKGEKIFGLSEHSYSIPLSYKILVSQDARISDSINWDYEQPIAIQGDFEKGEKKLLEFLNELLTLHLFDKQELSEQINETKQFLSQHKLKYIILECGEIYEMGDGELGVQNRELFENEILKIDKLIMDYVEEFMKIVHSHTHIKSEIEKLSGSGGFFSGLFSSGKSKKIEQLKKKIKNQEQEMWNMLGINNWSEVLYYHFENE